MDNAKITIRKGDIHKMDFELSNSEKSWSRTLDEFVEKSVTREYCRSCDQNGVWPYEAYAGVAKQGWLGLLIPKKYGGMESDIMKFALFYEAVGRYSLDISDALGAPLGTILNVVSYGSEVQKANFIPQFLKGVKKLSIGFTEPEAGSDAASASVMASIEADHFILNGSKRLVAAIHAEGSTILLTARTDPKAPKHNGISLFLVPNNTPGLEIKQINVLAHRMAGLNELSLRNVKVSKDNLLGELNKGWEYILDQLDRERIGIAAGCVGNAQTAVNDALNYAMQRVQFGQPIVRFQVINHMLADMQTEVDAARLLVYRAAQILSKGIHCNKEAAMAKLFAAEVFYRVTGCGMQILGGESLMPWRDMSRYWRDAKGSTIEGGTSQIQRIIIAREMMRINKNPEG